MARGWRWRPPEAILWLAGAAFVIFGLLASCTDVSSDFGLGPITTIENVVVMHTSAKPATVINEQDGPMVETIIMLGHDGQRYNCELPLLMDEEDLPYEEDDENDWMVEEGEEGDVVGRPEDIISSLTDENGKYLVQDIVQAIKEKNAIYGSSEATAGEVQGSEDEKKSGAESELDKEYKLESTMTSGMRPIKAEEIVSAIRRKADADMGCFYRQIAIERREIQEGYWTYEVCLGKEIRQYHQERDPRGKIRAGRSPDWSLGTFSKVRPQKLDAREQLDKLSGSELVDVLLAYNMRADGLLEKRELVDEIMSKIILSNPEEIFQKNRKPQRQKDKQDKRYPVGYGFEEYTDGQHCDETGSGRSTIVQYACDPSMKNEEMIYIAHIQEAAKDLYYAATARPTTLPKPPPGTAAYLLDGITGECYEHSEGWWTYKLCVGVSIQQYHKDADVVTQEYSLGNFIPETYPPKGSKAYKRLAKKEPGVEIGKPGQSTAIVQKYKGGEACDLTGSSREAEVRFICDNHNPESIESIREVKSCVYMLTFRTNKLCEHKLFKPPVNKVKSINCYPVIRSPLEPDDIEFHDEETCDADSCPSEYSISEEEKEHEEEQKGHEEEL